MHSAQQQILIDKQLLLNILNHRHVDYHPGYFIFLLTDNASNCQSSAFCQFLVTHFHTYGTEKFQSSHFAMEWYCHLPNLAQF